jgi:rRNA maturation RNase YbeY
LAIRFFSHHVTFIITGKKEIIACIRDILTEHVKEEGAINIILTGDSDLQEINKKYLKRDYLTDIITFDFDEKDKISGDLYISIERVKENALKFKVETKKELLRVIIHGVLHLVGYTDKLKKNKEIMTEMEEYYMGKNYKKRSDNL